ncbi:MAG: hypothetical protein MOGMAGMI_01625 [Candidatus Omnitrophica bacterium]|nr:hypothetical protein [Candidatus Omnitrophota bacterium]
MRTQTQERYGLRTIAVAVLAAMVTAPALAGDSNNISWSVVTEPARVAVVDGDTGRFRAQRWMDNGFAGGVSSFIAEGEPYKDVTVLAEGRAIADEGDYGLFLKLDHEDRGYVEMEFKQFRKYFDPTGGKYYPHVTLGTIEGPEDLTLDIGEFRVKAHAKLDRLPDVTFTYEHEYRDGMKSRLTWAAVQEGGLSRNVSPSWQDVDETTDSFEVRLDDTLWGWDWFASQYWESYEGDYTRYERLISTNTTASQRKTRDQHQDPEADRIATQLGVERWFAKDRGFFSSGYRYSQIENSELENIFERNEAGVLTNFSNPKQIRDSYATNQFNSHTWVGHFLWSLTDALTAATKLKAEWIERDSSSLYAADASPNAAGGAAPNGIIDQTDASEVDNKVRNFGESFSLRYAGIPRTALFAEYETEQLRNWLTEDRQSASASEVFNRESIAHTWRNAVKAGINTSPWDPVKLTLQARQRWDDINYNNVRYTNPTTSGARSVFVDGQDITATDLSSKLTYRPCAWLIPSVRYQRSDQSYDTWGVPDDQNIIESRGITDTYTADLTVLPDDRLSMTFSTSFQNGYVDTPAANSTSDAQSPRFNSDVWSWLGTADYRVNEAVTVDTLVRYSRADNFNDFTAIGLPYGSDYNEWEASLGLNWKVKPGLTVAPRYTLYGYNPNDMADTGRYTAHVVWVDCKIEWK